MQEFLDQASHNSDFYQCIEDNFKDTFCDWQITVLFYIGIHYMKALAAHRGQDIGHSHEEIERNVNPDRGGTGLKISRNAWREYKSLYRYSRTARYDGIADSATFMALKKNDLAYSINHLDQFKKYVVGQGVNIS